MHALFAARAVTVGEWNGSIPKLTCTPIRFNKTGDHVDQEAETEQNYWKALINTAVTECYLYV